MKKLFSTALHRRVTTTTLEYVRTVIRLEERRVMFKKNLPALASILLVVGCAPYASNIAPSPISWARYDGWSCDKLKFEQAFVEESLTRVSADQDSAASRDAWMVFLIGVPTSGGGVKGEVARLKGEQIALHRAMLEAGCVLPKKSQVASESESKLEPVQSSNDGLNKVTIDAVKEVHRNELPPDISETCFRKNRPAGQGRNECLAQYGYKEHGMP